MERIFLSLIKRSTNSVVDFLPRSIHVATEDGRFNEFTVLNSSLHVFDANEVIMNAVLFAIAGFPGRVRDAEAKCVWEFFEETLEQCAFAGT